MTKQPDQAGIEAELEEAEAKVVALKRQMKAGPCRLYGHDWQSFGGANAGCSDWCACSVPVNVCSKCGDCDYGDNEHASRTREDCKEAHLLKERTDG